MVLDSIERLLELDGRDVAEVAVETLGVVPVDPAERRELEVLDALPWPGSGGSANELGLVVAVDRLRQGIVIAVANRSDRGCGADLGEPFAVANRGELRTRIAMTPQIAMVVAPGPAAISIASRTISVRMCDATRQPTIIRENASMMKHT